MIRIGSRGSQLALWQAHHIAALLRTQGHEVEIEIIKTTGDRLQEVTFAQVGSKGMFTLEIEQALEAGRVDLAVHSLKDLPTELPPQFALGATPPRVDPRDVVVSKHYASFQDLPPGAKVGTSSLRRRAQLRHYRPDLEYIEFRGNVDTRLRKLDEGQAAATPSPPWAAAARSLSASTAVPSQAARPTKCTRPAMRFLDWSQTRKGIAS
jgi:hydroxymethylbilane synthase